LPLSWSYVRKRGPEEAFMAAPPAAICAREPHLVVDEFAAVLQSPGLGATRGEVASDAEIPELEMGVAWSAVELANPIERVSALSR
jgi:hypothetical protein